ncbi:DUF2318 domain-containing protein [Candidatus Woesearchaeota archaeon]|nr:DUF2318 domain-containing protein [Candidatus Woesearchaeota archaeon]
MKKTHVIILAIAVLAIGAALMKGSITGAATTNNGQLTIPLSELSNDAKWYEYDVGGKTIKFFAVKSGDGSIKTAFDACDVCYRSGKGYRQEGDYMVCNNCGNKYLISDLGTKNKNPGGCWPSFLPSYDDGQNLIIAVSDLKAGAIRFA